MFIIFLPVVLYYIIGGILGWEVEGNETHTILLLIIIGILLSIKYDSSYKKK